MKKYLHAEVYPSSRCGSGFARPLAAPPARGEARFASHGGEL